MLTQLSPHRLQLILLLLTSIPALQAHSQTPDTPSEAIDDQPLVTTGDLLRGFSNEELTRVQQLIPQRPEPPLAEAVPRIATIRGTVFLDANENGKQDANEKGLPNITVSDCQRLNGPTQMVNSVSRSSLTTSRIIALSR